MAVQEQQQNVASTRTLLLHNNSAFHKARATIQYRQGDRACASGVFTTTCHSLFRVPRLLPKVATVTGTVDKEGNSDFHISGFERNNLSHFEYLCRRCLISTSVLSHRGLINTSRKQTNKQTEQNQQTNKQNNNKNISVDSNGGYLENHDSLQARVQA